ncbi:hypothetical protein Q757_03205 [Oenococcus alcoholitolerans]|uniref:Small ribosomal subunit protein uS2 n=1 Tax=Oenococcus alcoholitolerans TaxID=931074 RepID=A0ABR4XRP1_9LACO|nr:hypothetical protein Q757_03205 [Oenococcus alcoholitolerans]
MAAISIKELLEAGAHFGHQTRRWDPRMSEYIFTSRNGIHIIDLQKTLRMADDAYNWVKGEAANGATFLFVGTKSKLQKRLKKKQSVPVYLMLTIAGLVELLLIGILLRVV